MHPVAHLPRQEEDRVMVLFVVVGFIDPVPMIPFSRDDWPRHITVSTNVEIDDVGPLLVTALAEALDGTGPAAASAGARAAFGPAGDVPVVLVEPSEPWRDLHERVRVVITRTGGRFTTPHTGDAYRPHVTDTRAGVWTGTAGVTLLHLVRLDGRTATVDAALPLA
jgi:hypothetical protein